MAGESHCDTALRCPCSTCRANGLPERFGQRARKFLWLCESKGNARERSADTVSEQHWIRTHFAFGLSTLVIDVTVGTHELRYLSTRQDCVI